MSIIELKVDGVAYQCTPVSSSGGSTPAPVAPITGKQITFPVPEGSPDGTTNSAPVAGTEFFALVKITERRNVQWGGQNCVSGEPVEAYWARTDGTPLDVPGSRSVVTNLNNVGGAFVVDPGEYQIRGKVLTGVALSGGFYVNNTTTPG